MRKLEKSSQNSTEQFVGVGVLYKDVGDQTVLHVVYHKTHNHQDYKAMILD